MDHPQQSSTSRPPFSPDILRTIFSCFEKGTSLGDVRSVSSTFCYLADQTIKVELELSVCYDGIKVETKINKKSAIRKAKLDSLCWTKKPFAPVLKYGCHKLSVECLFKDKQFSPFLEEVGQFLSNHPKDVFTHLTEFQLCLSTDTSYTCVFPSSKHDAVDKVMPKLIGILKQAMKRIEFYVFPEHDYMILHKRLVELKPRELHIAGSEMHLEEMLETTQDNYDTNFNIHVDRYHRSNAKERNGCLYSEMFHKLAKRWNTCERLHTNYINIIHQWDHPSVYRNISREYRDHADSWRKPLTICTSLYTCLYVGKGVVTFYVTPKAVFRFEHTCVGRTEFLFKAVRQCAVYVKRNDDNEMVNKAVLRPGETLESTSSGCLTTHIYICDVPDALLPFWSFKLFGGPAVIPGKKMPIAERENFDLPVQITLSRKRIVENVDARLQKAKKLGL